MRNGKRVQKEITSKTFPLISVNGRACAVALADGVGSSVIVERALPFFGAVVVKLQIQTTL